MKPMTPQRMALVAKLQDLLGERDYRVAISIDGLTDSEADRFLTELLPDQDDSSDQRGSLTWYEKSPDHWEAYSDQLLVGWVLKRLDGSLWYDATHAVFMKHISKGSGVVQSMTTGKRSIERAWETWLSIAGLRRIAR